MTSREKFINHARLSISPSGWLSHIRQHPSPNYDQRPPGTVPELIVIHGISLPPGEFGGPYIDALFSNHLDPTTHPYFATIQGLRVSAHLLIRRDGEMVQYVAFSARAWHAGQSRYQGRERCNDFSIGIELEGTDDCPYEMLQYEQLSQLIRVLKQHYPSLQGIAGHADIAPGRKTDPGPTFDWQRLYGLLAEARL